MVRKIFKYFYALLKLMMPLNVFAILIYELKWYYTDLFTLCFLTVTFVIFFIGFLINFFEMEELRW
jgi:hypothetical protein